MDFGDTSVILQADVLRDFAEHGRHLFCERVNADCAAALLADVRIRRRFDESLFLSEAEFDADPQPRDVDPRPGRNLLERFPGRLRFVEQAPHIVTGLTALLGEGYQMLDRKLVCAVPAKYVPAWLQARIAGAPVNNLGPYIRPEYRDIAYVMGGDVQQDLTSDGRGAADVVALCVYLHPVTAADAPLYILDGSHRLGASAFPHDVVRTGEASWRYRNGAAGETTATERVLTGPAGFAAIWHACTLHGAQPAASDEERISLRYLFARRPGVACGLDRINAGLQGAGGPAVTRKAVNGA